MSKTFLLMGSALLASAAIAIAGAAGATSYVAGVTFTSEAASAPLEPAGFTTIYSGTNTSELTFTSPAPCVAVTKTCSGITSGNLTNTYKAPYINGVQDTTINYLAVEPNSPVTVTPLKEFTSIAIYLGSLDTYNNVTFTFDVAGDTTQTLTGTKISSLSGSGVGPFGTATPAQLDGLYVFKFTKPIESFQIASSGSAFEIAAISGGVPEPASWALMLIGVAGLGGAMRLRRRQGAVAA